MIELMFDRVFEMVIFLLINFRFFKISEDFVKLLHLDGNVLKVNHFLFEILEGFLFYSSLYFIIFHLQLSLIFFNISNYLLIINKKALHLQLFLSLLKLIDFSLIFLNFLIVNKKKVILNIVKI